MNLYGVYRDGHPRLVLPLPLADGTEIETEFIVDTGFDGGLTLPSGLAHRLDARQAGYQNRLLADGSRAQSRVYEMSLTVDEDESYSVEVFVLEANPLLGTAFLEQHSLTVEVTAEGPVSVEPL